MTSQQLLLFGRALPRLDCQCGSDVGRQLLAAERTWRIGDGQAETAERMDAVGVLLIKGEGQQGAIFFSNISRQLENRRVGLIELGRDGPAGHRIAIDSSGYG